jgi:hypothetical protein
MLKAGKSWVRLAVRSFHYSMELTIPAALGPGVYTAYNRNEYQKKNLGSRALSVRKPANVTAICEPTVQTM